MRRCLIYWHFKAKGLCSGTLLTTKNGKTLISCPKESILDQKNNKYFTKGGHQCNGDSIFYQIISQKKYFTNDAFLLTSGWYYGCTAVSAGLGQIGHF